MLPLLRAREKTGRVGFYGGGIGDQRVGMGGVAFVRLSGLELRMVRGGL